jgi:hypothetical protein
MITTDVMSTTDGMITTDGQPMQLVTSQDTNFI